MALAGRVTSYSNHFPQLAAGLPAAGESVCKDTAERIVELAQGFVPVRTGALQGSIQVRRVANGYSASAGGTSVNDDGIDYAPFVEFGTRYMAAEPFFGPAVEIAGAEWPAEASAKFRAYFMGAHFGVSIKVP